MKQLVIISGKGGTGKTIISACFATLAQKKVVADCDVDAANLYLLLHPKIQETHQFTGGMKARIEQEKCTYCGKCAEVCAYNAIAVLKDTVLVFPELCHGCGGCSLLCPEQAIKEKGQRIGIMELGAANGLQFIHGKLDIGQAMSPPLIREVKKHMNRGRTIIIDAPPGTSCPVVESVKGSDVCLLVTEPTPFGLNDLRLAVETLRELRIPFGVILNRADIGDKQVQDYCLKENIPVLMTIPTDRNIAVAYSEGKTIIETQPAYKQKFLELFKKVQKLIK